MLAQRQVSIYVWQQEKGGVVMALIPKHLEPKIGPDLSKFSPQFESIWINLTIANKKQLLLIISYCPNKKQSSFLLNELALNLDFATTEIKQIIVTGDFNIDFLKKGEREKVCTVTTPYGLQVLHNKEPTRISDNSKTQTLIDYLTCEPSLFEKDFACDTNLKSDNFDVLGIFNCYAKTKQPRLITCIHEENNYNKSSYQTSVRDLNWSFLYNNNLNPSQMVEVFDYLLAQVLNHHALFKKC